MNEAVLLISAVVGIAAGLCTLIDFAERHRDRQDGMLGNAGRSLPQRERTTHEGPCTEVSQLVEGDKRAVPPNEKDRDPLGKGSRS